MNQHTDIAIIGASFAGLSAYRTLRKHVKTTSIKLFDMRPHFTWIPGLHEALLNPRRMDSLQFELKKLYGDDFVHQQVTDLKAHLLRTADGQAWTFDYGIIATGSRTNYFGKKDFEQFGYTLRYPEDVEQLNQVLPDAEHITIVGGGFTGIEIAAILASRDLRGDIRLIHSHDRLIQRLCTYTSKTCQHYLERHGVEVVLGNKVTSLGTRSVTLSNDTLLPSDVTILSSGIAINDEQHRPYLSFSTDGYTAQESDDIYFCGDVAIHGLYTTAHNAVLEGRRIGKLVADRIKGRQQTYPPLRNRDKLAIALGPYDGMITIGKRGVYLPWLTGLLKRAIEHKVMFEFKTGILFPF